MTLIRLVLLTALLAVPFGTANAHTQKPDSGSYRVNNGETFAITSLEFHGLTCTARVEISSSDESLATITAPAVYDVPYNEPHTFEVVADSVNTGNVTVTMNFQGIDRYNNDSTGPCWGQGSAVYSLEVVPDICLGGGGGPTRAAGRRVASRTAWDGSGNQWELVIENGVISGRVSSAYSANCIYDVSGSYDASAFTLTATYAGGESGSAYCCANTTPAVVTGTMSYADLLLVGDGNKVGYNNGDCGTDHYVLFGCNNPSGTIIDVCDDHANRWQLSLQADGSLTGFASAFNAANCIYGVTGSLSGADFTLSTTYVGGSANQQLCCANATTGVITGSAASNPPRASGTFVGYNTGSCGNADYLFSACDGGTARDYAIVLQDDTGNQWNLNAAGSSIAGFVSSYHSASCIYDVSGSFDASGFTLSATYVGGDDGSYFCCSNATTGVITGTLGADGSITASGTRIGYNNGECGSWDYTFTPRR